MHTYIVSQFTPALPGPRPRRKILRLPAAMRLTLASYAREKLRVGMSLRKAAKDLLIPESSLRGWMGLRHEMA